MHSEPAIAEVMELTRKFGHTLALDRVSLRIPHGRVMGLVGTNGAGKTTLIRHLLGLLKPQEGIVRVFDTDPIANPAHVLGRIGYLSEDRDLPPWMRVRELLAYTRAFFPGWDDAYARELTGMFGLPEATRVRDLSRGQKAQAGLVCALAHRPPLLLLDEPSSGLDPVVRRDILGAVIRAVADEGRTVVFSSHLLDEVERVADDIAMIHGGKLVLHAPLEELREGYRRVVVRFESPLHQKLELPGALSVEGSGREWSVLCNGDAAAMREALAARGATVVEETGPSLEDIFVARAGVGRASIQENATNTEE
jgi:ABC-2 type transport system ATP-binding protein